MFKYKKKSLACEIRCTSPWLGHTTVTWLLALFYQCPLTFRLADLYKCFRTCTIGSVRAQPVTQMPARCLPQQQVALLIECKTARTISPPKRSFPSPANRRTCQSLAAIPSYRVGSSFKTSTNIWFTKWADNRWASDLYWWQINRSLYTRTVYRG